MLLNGSSMIYILQISISAQVHINAKSQLPARFAAKALCGVAAPCPDRSAAVPGWTVMCRGSPELVVVLQTASVPLREHPLCALVCWILGEEQ